MGQESEVKQSPADRERQSIATQILGDWEQRYAPVIKNFSDDIIKALLPDSAKRKRAMSMAGTDVAAQASGAQQSALEQAGQTRTLNSAKQKLAITGTGDAQATKTALVRNDANQAVTDAGVAGQQAVVAQGQRIKNAAVTGFNRNAEYGEAQARADAAQDQARRAGYAQVGGSLAGMALGTWAMQPGAAPAAAGGTLHSGYVDPTSGVTLNNPSAWVSPG